MDFEDEDKPKYVSKTRRFAPGRARKSKPEPTPVHPSETDAPSESVSKKKTLMEEEEEEDVVVREIDVSTIHLLVPTLRLARDYYYFHYYDFANRFKCFDFSMMSQLYVLQYPLRPSWRAYEMDERCQEVSVVPFCFVLHFFVF